MKKYCLSVIWMLLLFCCAPALMAQNTPTATKEQNIRKLLLMTDARGIFKRSIEIQMDVVKTTTRDISPKFWDEVLKEIDPDKFIELIIPVYDKHFSNDELESIIAFYQTPVGKKLLLTLPQIMEESAAIGGKYGQDVANRVIKRMQAEGTFPGGQSQQTNPVPPLR